VLRGWSLCPRDLACRSRPSLWAVIVTTLRDHLGAYFAGLCVALAAFVPRAFRTGTLTVAAPRSSRDIVAAMRSPLPSSDRPAICRVQPSDGLDPVLFSVLRFPFVREARERGRCGALAWEKAE
jgi:hypothetical protein